MYGNFITSMTLTFIENVLTFKLHAEHEIRQVIVTLTSRANIIICRHHITSIRVATNDESDEACVCVQYEKSTSAFDIKCISSSRMTRNISELFFFVKLEKTDVKKLISIDRMKSSPSFGANDENGERCVYFIDCNCNRTDETCAHSR